MHTAPGDLYQRLNALNITVELVCAYMVIGNMNQRKGIFEGITEFSCSDPFLAYTYWFLMSTVFIVYKGGNHIPGLEVDLENKREDESTVEFMERIRAAKTSECDMRLEELSKLVDESKRNLYKYFFVLETENSSK